VSQRDLGQLSESLHNLDRLHGSAVLQRHLRDHLHPDLRDQQRLQRRNLLQGPDVNATARRVLNRAGVLGLAALSMQHAVRAARLQSDRGWCHLCKLPERLSVLT
jgi:hypothetical protein